MFRTLGFACLFGSLVLATACSDSDDNDGNTGGDQQELTAEEYDEVAASVGVVVAGNGGGEVASVRDTIELSLGVTPFGLSIDASGNISGNRAGVTYDYELSCEDAAGNSLERCSDATDSATVQVAWTGDIDLARFDSRVERQGEWSLTGLQSDTVEFNGDSTFSLDATMTSLTGTERTWTFDYDASYDAILITDDDFVGGKATYAVSGERTVTGDNGNSQASFDVDAEVTFNSDGSATLVIDGEHSYDLNLSTGDTTRR